METHTIVLKLERDGKVKIEIYDSNKNLICINYAQNIFLIADIIHHLFCSQVIIKESA